MKLNVEVECSFCSYLDQECLRFPDGMEYRGTIIQTADGQNCNYWNESLLPWISEEMVYIVGANQYCRNSIPGLQLWSPWCFTNYFYIGMCDIPFCGKLFEWELKNQNGMDRLTSVIIYTAMHRIVPQCLYFVNIFTKHIILGIWH